MPDFTRYLSTPEDREKLVADLAHLNAAVEPHIVGVKRVPVRVAALRRVLAAYTENLDHMQRAGLSHV